MFRQVKTLSKVKNFRQVTKLYIYYYRHIHAQLNTHAFLIKKK